MSHFEDFNEKEIFKMGDKEFVVDRPQILNSDDIENGDRVFVRTQSGNRYMLRHSKSRGGSLMIYNEKADGFKAGYPLHQKGNSIAEVGNEFDFIIVTDEEKNIGTKRHATEVVEIEIRRGFDEFIQNTNRGEEISFRDLTKGFVQALRDGDVDRL